MLDWVDWDIFADVSFYLGIVVTLSRSLVVLVAFLLVVELTGLSESVEM